MAKRSRSRSRSASRKSVASSKLHRHVSGKINAAFKRLDLHLEKEKRDLSRILKGCPTGGGYVPK